MRTTPPPAALTARFADATPAEQAKLLRLVSLLLRKMEDAEGNRDRAARLEVRDGRLN